MSRIAYEEWNPSDKTLAIIQIANDICTEYASQGYDLTLRQLYYQFVARDYLPNSQRSYKNLGTAIDKARKAGFLDWNYITDRTRNLMGWTTYLDPADLIAKTESRYHLDLWEGQAYRLEVWVEKEALASVVQRAALSRGVDYFSCRGYISQSELHAAAQRHRNYEDASQDVVVIHLGDHDPSGIDMTRDIQDRLALFGAHTTVQRIALNRDQIDLYSPPPNPAKLTDSRSDGYIARYGNSSWELDALDPATLNGLITETIDSYCDRVDFGDKVRQEENGRAQLRQVSDQWDRIIDALEDE